jgi:hypothetical protein
VGDMGGGIWEPACISALLCSEAAPAAICMVPSAMLIKVDLCSERCAATPICATPAMASARAVGLSTFRAFRNGHSTSFWTGSKWGWVLRPSLPCPRFLGSAALHAMRTHMPVSCMPTYPACMGHPGNGHKCVPIPPTLYTQWQCIPTHACACNAHACAHVTQRNGNANNAHNNVHVTQRECTKKARKGCPETISAGPRDGGGARSESPDFWKLGAYRPKPGQSSHAHVRRARMLLMVPGPTRIRAS